ncbi:helix-turn-helix transcriptional regulator [Streptomyces hainanensis]|uniref:Response regulator transcription factor n=1 Tax=Streptomyces hainanensis TaxID=402648 RepID=A0A4R4TD91_9ACTN|nr:response regulator transcription factor [Streptomyces hainanensis]TDC73524.1 response regulator transcription factor [Streptomyces hainanensis]
MITRSRAAHRPARRSALGAVAVAACLPYLVDRPWLAPPVGLAVLGALVVLGAGVGALLARLAPALLGPTPADRLAAAERRAADLAVRNRLARGESLLFPAAVRELARRHAPVPRADAPRGRLSEREEQVLRLLAEGLTSAEIADRLAVGAQTVKTHVAAVLAKLGARDRTQAVIAAYERGFVVPGRGA